MKFALIALVLVSAANAQFKCPPKDGQYEDSRQCDKFYQCEDGVAVEKLCPDGLVFDPLIRKINKCDQPFNVDCGDRTELRKYLSPLRLHPRTSPPLQKPPNRTTTAPDVTASSPTPSPPFATSSTTASKENTPRSPAPPVCTSTSSPEPASGLMREDDKDATRTSPVRPPAKKK
jgi:hypothetical protein